MNMKMKFIAAACLTICATGAFAAAKPVTCVTVDTTVAGVTTAGAVMMANTCTPDVTMYIAGSSALGNAIKTVVPVDLFDGAITKVADTASADGILGAVSAWYGTGKAGTAAAGKKLFVVYNNQNGSAAGISQLLSSATKDTTIPEADIVFVGPIGKTPNVPAATQAASLTANACTFAADTVDTATSITYHNVSCASHARTQADLGISDVAPAELFQLEGTKPAALTTLTLYPLAMQGFGVAVNNNFYNALQTKNVADKLLPSSCVAGDLTAACQPTIRKADYTSLISKTGSIKSAAGFIPADATVLTLARRDNLSGTQAASNIFFADNACGMALDSKGKAIKGVLGGALDILDTTPDATKMVVHLNATSGNVKTDLAAATGYSIGVIGLNTVPASTWKFVKIDGVSPNYLADGTDDTVNQRLSFAQGDYPFAVESFAAISTKAAKTSVANSTNAYHGLIATMVAGLKDSTLHNLPGIGYLDAGVAAQQSHVSRTNGNNCSPLTK